MNNNRPILVNNILNQHVNAIFPEPLHDQAHNTKVGIGYTCLSYVSTLKGVEDADIGNLVLHQRQIELNARKKNEFLFII